MRIGIGIAVSWEVFGAGHHVAILKAKHIPRCFGGNIGTVVAKRTIINDRIGRVIIDIGYGRKTDMNTQTAALARHFEAILVDQLFVANGTQGHLTRISNGITKAHTQSVLGIHGDHKWYAAQGLVAVVDDGLLLQSALKKAYTACFYPRNLIGHFIFVVDTFIGMRTQHEQLPHSFVFG